MNVNSSAARRNIVDLITGYYTFLESAMNPDVLIRIEELNNYFAEDILVQVNGEVTARTRAECVAWLHKLSQRSFILQPQLPFDEIVVSDDFKACVVHLRNKLIAPNGDATLLYVSAVCRIGGDGRFSKIVEVVCPEGAFMPNDYN